MRDTIFAHSLAFTNVKVEEPRQLSTRYVEWYQMSSIVIDREITKENTEECTGVQRVVE